MSGVELVHTPECPGPRIVERQTDRRRVTSCSACGASTSRERVNRWRDAR